jgi:hypothetical protein
MALAYLDSQVRDMIASADMIGFNAERTDLPRRTSLPT